MMQKVTDKEFEQLQNEANELGLSLALIWDNLCDAEEELHYWRKAIKHTPPINPKLDERVKAINRCQYLLSTYVSRRG